MKTDSNASCPRCGAALPGGVLSGHCPNCLITTALSGFFNPVDSGSANVFGSFGDYELLDEIARGGMGVVYRARQKTLNRLVAVKMLLGGEFASPDFVRRFQREAEAAARLQHPNIVKIHEVGQHKGQHFFSMELIEGSDLAHLVRKQPLPARRAALYLKRIAEAVAFAHGQGTLHRDLKPSNILIDPFDEPRITDFGLARHFQENGDLTLTAQALGSPAYISPEQAGGEAVGPGADIYSLGALAYHVLTGRPPFQGETIHEVLRQVQEREPLPLRSLNPSVPVDLQTICLKCLEKDPARRYPLAVDVAAELGRFLNDEPIQARPIGPLERVWRWSRRRPVTAGLAAALVIAIAAGVSGILWQWRRATLSEQVMALNLYAADMRAAANALAEGDLGQARRLLKLHEPHGHQRDLRGFEWRYLWARCQGEQSATFRGHDSIVTTTAFSRDGRIAASGGMDGRLVIWDLEHRTALTNFVTPGHAVWDVGFSDDDSLLFASGPGHQVQLLETKRWSEVTNFPGRLASMAGNFIATSDSSPFPWPEEPAGTLRVWNWKTGALVLNSPVPVRRMALSPDARLIAMVLTDQSPKIEIRETATGALKQSLTREKPVWSLGFSPDGTRLAAVGWNRNFTVFDLAGGESEIVTNAHDLTIWSARFSPDGGVVATASSDRSIAIWDAETLGLQRRLKGHENEAWAASFSRDGQSLISGGKDQQILLWDLKPKIESIRPPNSPLSPATFSPSGQWMLTRDQTNNTWHSFVFAAATRTMLSHHPGYALGFSADSRELVWFESSEAMLQFTTVSGSNQVRQVRLEIDERDLPVTRLSADGRRFFCVDRQGLASVWDLMGKRISSFPTLKPPIRAASISPDGNWLALSVERDYDVHLYALPAGTLRKLHGHRDHVTGLAFSPDSKIIATGSVDADVRLFETGTGLLRTTLSGHLEEASDVAFSPDGKTLASVGNQSALKLWHLPTSREVVSLPIPDAGFHLAFSPDGRRLTLSHHDQKLQILEAP